MKVGIISMQRVPNYGSFLQAMGLKKTIEKLGHEVVFIDYKPGRPVVGYSKKRMVTYYCKSTAVGAFTIDYIKFHFLQKDAFIYYYNKYFLRMLGIGYKKNYSEKVDIVVIGSDEVFNCLQSGANVGFSKMLFGQGVNATKVISYAASFGYTTLDGIYRYTLQDVLSQYLESFSDISVRDDNSKTIINKLTGKMPAINLDPVLIYDYELPEAKVNYTNYIVLYTYKTRSYTEEEKNAIIHFCQKEGKILLAFGNTQNWIPNKLIVDPLILLAYIKNADYVITDTFHGTVFSIKYNKPFSTLVRNDNQQKLSDLLTRLKQEKRSIDSFASLEENYRLPIDWDETNRIILTEKNKAIRYLERNLS